MAYTKVFAIRRRLDDRIHYVTNGEKTALDAGITYAANPEKTEQYFFTSALNCESCETAYAEMQATKQRFGKLGGVVGYHFIQSFAPGELTELLHQMSGVAVNINQIAKVANASGFVRMEDIEQIKAMQGMLWQAVKEL